MPIRPFLLRCIWGELSNRRVTRFCVFSVLVRKAEVSRITREFSEVTQASSQSVVETNKQVTTSSSTRLVPGMSQYDEDVEIHDCM